MGDGETGASASARAAQELMAAYRCRHQVLHEIDGLDGWYRCQRCGDFMEFPVVMKAHPPSDMRRMIRWFEAELARWPGGPNPTPLAALDEPNVTHYAHESGAAGEPGDGG